MRFRSERSHMIDLLFPVILLFVFALSAVAVILLAGNVYSESTEKSALNYTARTSLGYIREKVHQGDSDGAVYLGEIGEEKALVLEQEIDGTAYCTYIYEYEDENGAYLKEMFARKDATLSPATGQTILEVSDFNIEKLDDSLYSISCTDEKGVNASTVISIKSTSN